MDLLVADVFSGRQLGVLPASWILLLFTIGMAISSGLMLTQYWQPPGCPMTMLLLPVVHAADFVTLCFAWRIWFDQGDDPGELRVQDSGCCMGPGRLLVHRIRGLTRDLHRSTVRVPAASTI